jgi:hypothetical protein
MVRTCLLLAAALAMSSSAVAGGSNDEACGGFCDVGEDSGGGENTRPLYRSEETQSYGSTVERGKAGRSLNQRQQNQNPRPMQE